MTQDIQELVRLTCEEFGIRRLLFCLLFCQKKKKKKKQTEAEVLFPLLARQRVLERKLKVDSRQMHDTLLYL